MSSQLIVPATEYSPLPKPHERRFDVNAYGWQVAPKKEPLQVKQQLPNKDWDKLHSLWESTDKMIDNQRYEDQADFKNEQRQLGKVMHSGELVKRILKLNSRLVVQDSKAMKGNAAFYFVEPDKSLRYTNASFEKGWVPEFTIMKTDAADLPSYYPRYSWRTVLVRLLKGGYITWQQVLNVFGDVTHNDTRAKHWHLNTHHLRY